MFVTLGKNSSQNVMRVARCMRPTLTRDVPWDWRQIYKFAPWALNGLNEGSLLHCNTIPHCNNLICCTLNIAFQLVLQLCCNTSFSFLLYALKYRSFNRRGSCLYDLHVERRAFVPAFRHIV